LRFIVSINGLIRIAFLFELSFQKKKKYSHEFSHDVSFLFMMLFDLIVIATLANGIPIYSMPSDKLGLFVANLEMNA
jgi:hypothetical protein